MGIVLDMLSGNRFPLLVESTIIHPPFGKVSDMEVEARRAEGPVVGVAIGGLEVTGGVELRRVPETAAEVREEREVRP